VAAAHGITVDLIDDGLLDRPEPVAAHIPARQHRDRTGNGCDAAAARSRPPMLQPAVPAA
jgi:hypothetical protein